MKVRGGQAWRRLGGEGEGGSVPMRRVEGGVRTEDWWTGWRWVWWCFLWGLERRIILARPRSYWGPTSTERLAILLLPLHRHLLTIIITCMSANLRFRVESVSSQGVGHPASNLLARHSHWESQRFCDYPQQLTLAFAHPVSLSTITIAAHSTKIPTRINILYHLPSPTQTSSEFQKYGYLQFGAGNQHPSNPVEVKHLDKVGLKVLQVRLIILHNHQNKHNFFNQVALSQLAFTGHTIEHLLPPPQMNNSSVLLAMGPQISVLTQLKNSFVRREEFEEAKQVKQLLNFLEKAGGRMEEMKVQKQQFVRREEFMEAKRVKGQMEEFRQEIEETINGFYDPERKMLKSMRGIDQLRSKMDQMGMEQGSPSDSRVQPSQMEKQDEVESEEEGEGEGGEDYNMSMVSHDERILPAVINKMKGINPSQTIPEKSQIGDNQFFEGEKSPELPEEPQKISPSDEANSSHLLEFYDNLFIRKLHSKWWQFRLQAINQVLAEVKGQQSTLQLTKDRLRAYLFIYCQSLKSTNYAITIAALQFMSLVAPIRPQGEHKHQLHNQLQQTLTLTLKKLNDSNQKIRQQAQKTLLRILESPFFGVANCYNALVKSYPQKANSLLRKTKLQDIEFMVERHGLGQNGVPQSVAQFAVKAANDQDGQVRKSALNLLKAIKSKGGKQRVEMLLQNEMEIKPSIARQLAS